MTDVEQLSQRLRLVCRGMQILAGLACLALIVGAFHGDSRSAVIDTYWQQLTAEQQSAVLFSPAKQALLHTIAGIVQASPILTFMGVAYVFGRFAQTPALSPRSVGSLRWLGLAIIVRGMTSVFTATAMVLALTHDSVEGMRVLTIGFGTHHVLEIAYGVLLVVLGAVLAQALTIAEEHRQIV